jgi:hypothetical protein
LSQKEKDGEELNIFPLMDRFQHFSKMNVMLKQGATSVNIIDFPSHGSPFSSVVFKYKTA